MYRLYLTITEEEREELKQHLYMNGYYVEWETDDVISVSEEEISYVKTILYDRNIGFTDDIIEVPFGNMEIKHKVDKMVKLAKEIMELVEDCGEYSEEENEMLDEVANVISTYKNTFNIV